MKVTSLQTQYVQKSRIFLYPLLGIKRGTSITPIQTYMSWDEHYATKDFKLICTYHLRKDAEFTMFEQTRLIGNPYYESHVQLEDNICAYVFNLSEFSNDYTRIVNGKYSALTEKIKIRILAFFQNQSNHHINIQSYLSPEKFMHDYAELLTHGGKAKDKASYFSILAAIKNCGELCSTPDLSQEKLIAKEKNINFELYNSNNQQIQKHD